MSRATAPPSPGQHPFVRSLRAGDLDSLLGPAEAQYGEQALAISLYGEAGPLACGANVVDQGPDDIDPAPGMVGVSLIWNDLVGETGYRVQADVGSASFLVEDSHEELPANVPGYSITSDTLPASATLRVLGHVGHAPDHGATPIPGDVVSNECFLSVSAADS